MSNDLYTKLAAVTNRFFGTMAIEQRIAFFETLSKVSEPVDYKILDRRAVAAAAEAKEGVEMSDVMRVGGGTFNVPVDHSVDHPVVHPVVHYDPHAANFINWVVRIPLPLELSATEEVNSETQVDYTPTTEDVSHAIERTIDHLVQGRTTPDQRRSLGKAVERADRVAPDTDRAFGRILGG